MTLLDPSLSTPQIFTLTSDHLPEFHLNLAFRAGRILPRRGASLDDAALLLIGLAAWRLRAARTSHRFPGEGDVWLLRWMLGIWTSGTKVRTPFCDLSPSAACLDIARRGGAGRLVRVDRETVRIDGAPPLALETIVPLVVGRIFPQARDYFPTEASLARERLKIDEACHAGLRGMLPYAAIQAITETQGGFLPDGRVAALGGRLLNALAGQRRPGRSFVEEETRHAIRRIGAAQYLVPDRPTGEGRNLVLTEEGRMVLSWLIEPGLLVALKAAAGAVSSTDPALAHVACGVRADGLGGHRHLLLLSEIAAIDRALEAAMPDQSLKACRRR